MEHRGPDNSSWIEYNQKPYFFLGFTRLAIIDLHKRSNQPYKYKNLIICFNGEIYNFLEIKKDLISKGIKFETKGDCEVLIKLIYHEGIKSINRLEGMWSFVLYDEKKMTLPVNEVQEINPYINDYIFSKYLSEEIVKYYSSKVPSIIVRLSNIYGYTKLVRPDLVPTIMQDIFTKKEVKIWNDKPERDFIFTEDAAEAVLRLLETDYTGIVNLGTGTMDPINKISAIVEELSGKKILSENKPVSGPMKLKVDISLVKKLTGWKPTNSLKEGLTKTYNIMKEYYKS